MTRPEKHGVLTATDAKGTVITNAYDKANRVITRTYSNEPTGVTTPPAVNFYYDGKGLAQTQNQNYAKGKLTRVTSSVSETQYSLFDNFGRLTESKQITDGQTYTSSYQYNLSGALVQETYPSGRVVKNEFESDGDIARIYGTANPNATERTYATSFSYTPDGKIARLRLGNGLWESAKFNTRLQVTELSLGHGVTSGDLWKLGYEFGEIDANGNVDATKNTGNIARQTLSFNGLAQPFVQSYKYDSLYRLTEAKETNNGSQTWKEGFGYDRYGNRSTHSKFAGTTQLTGDNKTDPTIDPATNRFNINQGYGFDKNGNLTTDAENRGFSFNGDNKQTKVIQNGKLVGEYFFDGEGKRVSKKAYTTAGDLTEETIFVYSTGKLIAEYSTKPPPRNPTTSYTATDQLGSPRVITNSLGEVVSRRDFMPFGEAVVPDGANRTTGLHYTYGDDIRQKFTGYQKDEETNLDFAEARMYQNLHGRFTAVDPLLASGKSANPQSFNRFVYCLNNPLMFTDSQGLQVGKPTGNWYQPKVPDGVSTYVYRSSAPDGYEPVTKTNNAGDLVGTGVGLPEGYELRFSPYGPLGDQAESMGGATVLKMVLTDFAYNGFERVMTDEFRAQFVEPIVGVQDAISPYELAALAAPVGRALSPLGKGAMETTILEAEDPLVSLVSRTQEIHGVLEPIAQRMRTTAIVETEEGINIVASSRNTLTPAQRSMLRANEIEAFGPGHAEETALNKAAREGLTPVRVAASRTICSGCQEMFFKSNLKPIDPFLPFQ